MRWLRNLLLAGGALTLLAAGYLWLTLLSPYGYQPPEGLPAIDETRSHRVFVYGTLRYGIVRALVIGRTGDPQPALLPGFQKQGLDIEPRADARTEGLVFEVDADELRRLDRYERLGIHYDRVRLTLADGTRAWVYRRRNGD